MTQCMNEILRKKGHAHNLFEPIQICATLLLHFKAPFSIDKISIFIVMHLLDLPVHVAVN